MANYGLKETSGLGARGEFHVSISYDCNGMVFVQYEHPEWGPAWKRVAPEKADPEKVIKCSQCDRPAVSLDHYWPYHSELCLCAEHYEEIHKTNKPKQRKRP